MKRRDFLTAALDAPAALASSSALATAELPQLDIGGCDATPCFERHVALIVSPRGPWKPAGIDDKSIAIDAVHCKVPFDSHAEASEYCRAWNSAELVNRKGYWALTVTARFTRTLNNYEWCVVAIVSRKPRQDRTIEVFGPFHDTLAESFADGFNESVPRDDRDSAIAVVLNFTHENLEDVATRRFQVVLVDFDQDGNPTLNPKGVVLDTPCPRSARAYVKAFNRSELCNPVGCWAAIRVVECGGKGGAA